MKIRQRLINFAKLGFAIGLIWYLIARGHLDLSLFSQLLAPQPLVLGLGLVGTTILVQAWRWQILLLSRGFTTSYLEATRLFLIGTFFNYALPGSIGGDVVKGYYIAQDNPQRRVDAVLTVILDRLLGLYAMVILALSAIVVNWPRVAAEMRLKSLALGTLIVFLLMTLFWLAAFSRRFSQLLQVDRWLQKLPLQEKLLRLYRATQAYSTCKSILLKALILSAVAQVISTGFMMMVGFATGHSEISIGTYFFAVPLGFIAASLPIAPAGLGVGQVAFLVLFQLYSGQASQLGQVAITAFQMALLAWGLVGALLYLQRGRRPEPSPGSA
ncbi:MAG: lysylphosphatidylglycerol synthase transmembrane domain-containing protein [Bdellovibrionales bacterium]